ncbi:MULTISPECIES: hypothetical protein [unclassified Breznakia]|uniref:hypothetical protein n=1 Tax=unclassified Breznakia TaxID=2623764 RepID=UPI00247310FB|nr:MULTISPECIES: hypothetical protein [unclassified Breznakia]MDH6368219.1 hypothetical protein [Breznakia sp. PH1-1]MDH6405313.1 hypothetical protein [Breznakia sp. PF1-11]MDH6413021.1 hypothetical protein [Breznakia sp. PFB1-11]MDH6415388.1 hypothetical protein [Breznakia sp. PFB1-14]MDH6417688.1 hypothetical protein [Breznakia sp. PFB1-4]
MINKNDTYKWWIDKKSNKIKIDDSIFDCRKPIRGIYGIFIYKGSREYCAYVGKSTNIYARFFCDNGHLVQIKNECCNNKSINDALQDYNSILEIRILEEVVCQYDDYFKDMQRLSFAENYYISKYQELNQCLEQLPDGSNMDKLIWEQEKKKNEENLEV